MLLYHGSSASKNLESLPIEIIQKIASHLLLSTELINLSVTNHRIFDVLNSPMIYKQHVAQLWDVDLWEQELRTHPDLVECRDQNEKEAHYLRSWKQICDLHSKVECLLRTAESPPFERDWVMLENELADPTSSDISKIPQLKDVLWEVPLYDESQGAGTFQYIRTWITEIGLFLPHILNHHEHKNMSNLLSTWHTSRFVMDAACELQEWVDEESGLGSSFQLHRPHAILMLHGKPQTGVNYCASFFINYSLYFSTPRALDWECDGVDLLRYHLILGDLSSTPNTQSSFSISRALCFPGQVLMTKRIHEYIRLSRTLPSLDTLPQREHIFPPINPFATRNLDYLPFDNPEDLASQTPKPQAVSLWFQHCLYTVLNAFETEEEFTGYYSYDGETQISDGPMQMSLSCERVTAKKPAINHCVFKGRGSDSVGEFTIRLLVGCDGSVEGSKNYENHSWQWIGVVTALGLFGVWGSEGFSSGLWWIWPKTWSINHLHPDTDV